MSSQTLKAPARRRLRFLTHGDILTEVRSLAGRPTRQLGNWSLPAITQHLAAAMNLCIDGDVPFRVPLTTRILARIYRKRILNGRLPVGFKLPEGAVTILYPEPESMDAAIAELEKAIARLKTTNQRVAHPALGSMNAAQWDLFHLRHAELHLSFIVPEV
jgi:hypothetical protein